MDLVELEQRARSLVTALAVVCVAFVLSQAFYFGIVWFLLRGPLAMEAIAPSLPDVVSWSLAAAVLLLVIGAPALQSALLRQARESAGSVEEYVARHRSAAVVGYAARESAGVIGLVLSLLSGDLGWSMGLGGLAVLALLGAWPRRSAVVEGIRAVELRLETEREGGSGTGTERPETEPRRS